MPRKPKLWASSYPRVLSDKTRHSSLVAAYRYVERQAALWQSGILRSRHLTVWVDERDGRGWQRFEDIDLDELPKEPVVRPEVRT